MKMLTRRFLLKAGLLLSAALGVGGSALLACGDDNKSSRDDENCGYGWYGYGYGYGCSRREGGTDFCVYCDD